MLCLPSTIPGKPLLTFSASATVVKVRLHNRHTAGKGPLLNAPAVTEPLVWGFLCWVILAKERFLALHGKSSYVWKLSYQRYCGAIYNRPIHIHTYTYT